VSAKNTNFQHLLLGIMLCGFFGGAKANQVSINDDFDFGLWNPFLTKWQKRVPVCVWDEINPDSTFKIEVSGMSRGRKFRLAGDTNTKIPYDVHWLHGSAYQDSEKLKSGKSSNGVFYSRDANRCASGATIDPTKLGSAPTGIYSDTLVVTISPL